ncbi:uncharacterized protein A1O9_09914 [Exophiala aquamarina CBS 119918]|uniref:Zn(2)-C6 fungal-type domain-containing protein n=1 Tax=Exophiala aquamarina CBS 119918 TaxID=1182545 RepID=A0A072P1W2_9EURO|nr:uncharacterized protein A1O9_09914 [Exophiala aquamarina CBS 119918]KEF54119.1 hypothetical protein A1O9_09914 [Exophiala aquamarina CBS 119918]
MDLGDSDSHEAGAKRRRLRKGTHSCWECKRRKVRCSFESATDATCVPCRRRGAKCINQDLPEDASLAGDGTSLMVRVEELLNHLVNKVEHSGGTGRGLPTPNIGQRPTPVAPTPASDSELTSHTGPTSVSERTSCTGQTSYTSGNFDSPEKLAPETGDAEAGTSATTTEPLGCQTGTRVRVVHPYTGKYEKVSQALVAAFPAQRDIDILLETGRKMPMLCGHLRNKLGSGRADRPPNLKKIPSTRTHPVLLARQMLIFATFLLYVSVYEKLRGLSEHHRCIRERLVDTATSLVTTNEELFGTIESLECMVYEGFYHLDYGNIWRGWLAFRRAMGGAQLMGIDRPRSPSVKILDPETDISPQALWFRIVYMDRFLSLMLGLPAGNLDLGIQPDPTVPCYSATVRLELVHATISAKILERNRLNMSQSAMDMTLDIDKELLKGANSLPGKFWEPTSFAGLDQGSNEAFLETMRARDQIYHYTLLNQLHLPFLFCPTPMGKNEYSRITCANASRQILTRFFVFRSFNNISACCRLVDFLALVAGMTLILAHLDSHCHQERENLLAHQRMGDRATVEQALSVMELNSRLNEDMLAAKCAELLKHLLDIEADAAHGPLYSSEDGGEATTLSSQDNTNVLLIAVPYRGTVKITRKGIGFVEKSTKTSLFSQDLAAGITIGGIGSVNVASPVLGSNPVQPVVNAPTRDFDHTDREIRLPRPPLHNTPPQHSERSAAPGTSQHPTAVVADVSLQQQELYPGVAADLNHWVFQGIDTAFFDSLMGESGVDVPGGDGVADWNPSWHTDLSG